MTTRININDLKTEYPIIIVGGGLVGATLSIALNQIGIESLVVEAFEQDSKQQPSFDDRTVALSSASVEILDSIGLNNQLIGYCESIQNIHVSDQGHYGFCRLESKKLGVQQLGAVIENKRLGNILLKTIASKNIHYLAPATVQEINLNSSDKNVLIESDGKEKPINCQLVILAEGARSKLKNSLQFESKITNYNAAAVVCNVETQLPHQNWAFERFTENGPLALLPLSQNRLSIVWSQPAEESNKLLAMSEHDFAKKLEQVFGSRLGRVEKVGKRNLFPLMQYSTDNTIKSGCLLFGNSAQALHPIAGQGLNLALRDIAELQKLLVESSLVKTKKSLGNYQLLREFQERRKQDRQQILFATEALARLFSNPWKPLSVSRNLLMKAMDITPTLKQEFARAAMGYRS